MSLFQKILLLCLIACLTSCYSGDSRNSEGGKRLSQYSVSDQKVSRTEIVEEDFHTVNTDLLEPDFALASEVFKNRRYIELKTPKGIVIGQLSKIQVSEEHILVLDRHITKKAYLFDKNGEFIHVVGKNGRGPGEHLDPIDIFLKNGVIYITDREFAVHLYHTSNDYIRRFELPFFGHSSYVFNDGTIAFSNNMLDDKQTAFHLLMINGSSLVNRAFEGIFQNVSTYAATPIGSNPKFNPNSFLFYQPFDNSVYEVSQSRIELKYRLTGTNLINSDVLSNHNLLKNTKYEYTWVYDWPILENSTITQIRIINNGILTLFLNRKSGLLKSYSGIKDDLLYGGITDFPLYVYGEDFYNVINVEQLHYMKNELEKVKDDVLKSELRAARPEVFELMENIDELSNPIIMVCDIL